MSLCLLGQRGNPPTETKELTYLVRLKQPKMRSRREAKLILVRRRGDTLRSAVAAWKMVLLNRSYLH